MPKSSSVVSLNAQLHAQFWQAPDHALLSRAAVAAGLCGSVSWLEQLALKGGGPRMQKLGKRRVLYLKVDVLMWLQAHSQTVESTSQLVS